MCETLAERLLPQQLVLNLPSLLEVGGTELKHRSCLQRIEVIGTGLEMG
jgi:hypothetical protein